MMKFVWVAVTLLALAGCAEGPNSSEMTVAPVASTVPTTPVALQNAFAIGTVTGGHETNPLWESNVSDGDFSGALQQSLSDASMLGGTTPRYTLNAVMVSLDRPIVSLNTTVTADVHYTVVRKADSSVALDTEVVTPYTASIVQQPIGFMRLEVANAGAMKANIAALMTQLQAAGQPGGKLAE